MSRNVDLLFCKYDLRSAMDGNERKMYSEIEQYDPNKLLNTSTDDLAKYFVEKFLIAPVELDENNICVDQGETKIDVSHDFLRSFYNDGRPQLVTGVAFTLEVPFTGESDLFQFHPSTFNLNPPRAQIQGNILYITTTSIDKSAETIKSDLSRQLDSIKEYLSYIKHDLEPWNSTLYTKAFGKINSRKEKLLADRKLVTSLGFPIKKRDDATHTYSSPVVRRISPKIPIATATPYVPEPELVMAEYENILSIVKMTARMLERSPHAFKGMEEEHLRDQFLVPLNSHYEGQASGETFNFNGKTDILIQTEGRAIFIAECKIWRGSKALLDALDQILGYATWRDTKIALIIFNRNKDFTDVLYKIPETVKSHPNFKRKITYGDETTFRFIVAHKDDRNRELTLTVLAFEVPA